MNGEAWRVHETRIFPKYGGAERYAVTGLAARCDLVVLSDRKPPFSHIIRISAGAPRLIFISLRNHEAGLRCFLDDVLPKLECPFVVVSGSEDVTFPEQRDARSKPYSPDLAARIETALDHPLLIRWYAENLSRSGDARLAPLPLGMVFRTEADRESFNVPTPPAPGDRSLSVFCAHRVRGGVQWETRRRVTALAKTAWASVCHVPEDDLPLNKFDEALRSHAFVLCAEGGGYDPSPKAWRSLLMGAIPIIRDGPTAAGYRALPVVILPDWTPDALDPAKLASWRDRLTPWFARDGRRKLIERLGADFWHDIVRAGRQAPKDAALLAG